MFTQHHGSKRFIVAVVVIATIITLFAGCAGLSDWAYPLPYGYEIWRINSERIVLVKNQGETSDTVIEDYIISFCHNECYIGIQNISLRTGQSSESIGQIDTSNPDYYLVDAASDEVFGPYTAEEYKTKKQDLNTGELGTWIDTSTRPEGAY